MLLREEEFGGRYVGEKWQTLKYEGENLKEETRTECLENVMVRCFTQAILGDFILKCIFWGTLINCSPEVFFYPVLYCCYVLCCTGFENHTHIRTHTAINLQILLTLLHHQGFPVTENQEHVGHVKQCQASNM